MDKLNGHIFNKFQVKEGEPLPHTGLIENTNRQHLAELFFELGYKVGAEIGVLRGDYSEVLLKSNPNLKLFCIDPWAPFRKSGQVRMDWFYRKAVRNLNGLNAEFVRKSSKAALSAFPDSSLDFVYIDGLHDFDNVMFDIIEWSKKVRSGGIVAGHDYIYLYGVGVIFAVNAYTAAHSINPWYLTKDNLASWFWVKS